MRLVKRLQMSPRDYNESRVLDSVSHSISRLMEVAWCLSVSLRLDNTVCTALIERAEVHISAERAF